MEDYVCWSAPVEDLSDWRREGMIFRKSDDPNNRGPVGYLYAPDVAQGPDGRYYLYYFYTGDETRTYKIGVAVCDTPAGQYQYYGTIEPDNGNSFLNLIRRSLWTMTGGCGSTTVPPFRWEERCLPCWEERWWSWIGI